MIYIITSRATYMIKKKQQGPFIINKPFSFLIGLHRIAFVEINNLSYRGAFVIIT